jgi:hypothetical protein
LISLTASSAIGPPIYGSKKFVSITALRPCLPLAPG